MELHLACILLFLATTYILTFMKKKKKLPPGPTGLPLIGSFLTIGDRVHESLAKLSQTYGPLMTLRLGLVNVVVVSSADMAKEIFHSHGTTFMGRPTPDAVTAETGHELSLPWLPPGPHWTKLRKICNVCILSPQKLDSIRDSRHRAVDDMVRRVSGPARTGEAVEIGGLVFATAIQLLSNSLFTTDMLDPASDAMKELQLLNANIMALVGRPNLSDYFPFLRPFDPQGIKREIKRSYDRLHQLIDDMIENRRVSKTVSDDILDDLLDYTEDTGPQGLTRFDVKLLITEVFIGGTDTTSVTVEWVMAELLHNPAVLSRLRRELSEKIATGEPVREQDIPRLAYLTAVIKETMRLHSVSPLLLPRRAEQDAVIRGYTVPKHTRVWVNFWAISRDPEYWDEPTRFVPERFLEKSDNVGFRGSSDCSFTPFGGGRRVCPGLELAVRMVSLIVGSLVQEFEWKLADGVEPENMDMSDVFGLTLRKAQPLSAIPFKITR